MAIEDLIGMGFFPELDEEFEGLDAQIAARDVLSRRRPQQGNQSPPIVGVESFNPTGGHFGGEFDPSQTVDPGEQLIDRIMQARTGRAPGRGQRINVDGINFDVIGGRARARAGVKIQHGPLGPGTGGTITQDFDEPGFSPVTPEIQARAQAEADRIADRERRLRATLITAGLTGGADKVQVAHENFQRMEAQRELNEQKRQDTLQLQEEKFRLEREKIARADRIRQEDLDRRERERKEAREQKLEDTEADFKRRKELGGVGTSRRRGSGSGAAGEAGDPLDPATISKNVLSARKIVSDLLSKDLARIDKRASDTLAPKSEEWVKQKRQAALDFWARKLQGAVRRVESGHPVDKLFLQAFNPDAADAEQLQGAAQDALGAGVGADPEAPQTGLEEDTTIPLALDEETGQVKTPVSEAVAEPGTAARAAAGGGIDTDLTVAARRSGKSVDQLAEKVLEVAGPDLDMLRGLRNAFETKATGRGLFTRFAESPLGILSSSGPQAPLVQGLRALDPGPGTTEGGQEFGSRIKRIRKIAKPLFKEFQNPTEAEARLVPALIDRVISILQERFPGEFGVPQEELDDLAPAPQPTPPLGPEQLANLRPEDRDFALALRGQPSLPPDVGGASDVKFGAGAGQAATGDELDRERIMEALRAANR